MSKAPAFRPEQLGDALRALSSARRRAILDWLKDPAAHFPAHETGDLARDGVSCLAIAEKLGVSQPTTSGHLKILAGAGLIRARRIRNWTFYRRREKAIRALKEAFAEAV